MTTEAAIEEAAEFYAARLREQKEQREREAAKVFVVVKCGGVGPPVEGCSCSFCQRNSWS